jgi:hypothetical protein
VDFALFPTISQHRIANALRVSFISVKALHKEGFGSISIARRKSDSFFEEPIRR